MTLRFTRASDIVMQARPDEPPARANNPRKIPKGKPTTCKCGLAWVSVWHENSGTTDVTLACPVIRDEWAPGGPYGWRHEVPGHQYVITTTAQHAATRCCNVFSVQG